MMNIVAGYFADVDGNGKSAFRRNECPPPWAAALQCSVFSGKWKKGKKNAPFTPRSPCADP
jgi:hypothetical protein